MWVGSSLGQKAGDKIRLLINDHTREYTVRGVFDDHGEGGGVIVMDMARRRDMKLGREGRVDRDSAEGSGRPAAGGMAEQAAERVTARVSRFDRREAKPMRTGRCWRHFGGICAC